MKKENLTYDFFYNLSIQSSFKKDVRNFRSNYGLKEDGYDFEKDSDSWYIDLISFITKNHKLIETYASDIKELANKYKVPANLFSRFRSLIMFENSNSFIQDISLTKNKKYAVDYSSSKYSDNEDSWKDTGRPYVKLLISENWTVDGITSFLTSQRKSINMFFDKNRQLEKTRDRKLNNLNRDKIICELWKLSMNKLKERSELKFNRQRKESVVSFLLKRDHQYDISPEAVKKVSERQAKIRDK